MSKTPFTPEDLQFNLRIKLHEMHQGLLHPAAANALVAGAIDGLSTGVALLKAGYTTSFGSEISELFVKYQAGEIATLFEFVELVNKNLITKDVLKPTDFASGSTYGHSSYVEHYCVGFQLAHSWAIKLYWSAVSHGIEHFKARSLAVKQIESMNLYSVL